MALRWRITKSWPAGRHTGSSCTTTSYMTREWNTRRISVINRTTKGKNERMALAATENAKVWTSVRSTYLVVASTRPERRGVRAGGSPGPELLFAGVIVDGGTLAGAATAGAATAGAATAGLATAGGTIVVGGVDKGFWLNPSRVSGVRRRLPEPKF